MTDSLLRMSLLCSLALPMAAGIVMSGCEDETPRERARDRIEEAGDRIEDATDEVGR